MKGTKGALVQFCMLLAAGLFIMGCGKEEAQSAQCRPIALAFYYSGIAGDSVAYRYDSQNRLIQMAYYALQSTSYFLWKSTEVSYNSSGQPDTIRQRVLLNTGEEQLLQRYTFKMHYNTKGLPDTVHVFSGGPLYPGEVFYFAHDAAGRLVYKSYDGGINHQVSYSYTFDGSGNLTSYDFQDYNGTVYQGRSNSAFDNSPQFFQASAALTIINTYLTINNEPGKNNPTLSIIYKVGGNHYTMPQVTNITYTYNDQGWPLTVSSNDARLADRKYYYACP